MTTAAVYARISSDPTGKELGVQRQIEACRRYARSRGLTILREYVENDTSAFKGTRPKFDQMLTDIAQFDTIIVWAADRLYRRMTDLERLVDALGSTPVYAVKSGDIDLSTADGRMTARMHGTVAQHSSEKSAERLRAAFKQAKEQGRWLGVCPRGYIRTRGVMAVDPEWGPKVAEAAQHVLAGGSIRSKARDLGIGNTSLRKLLKCPALAGLTSDLQPGQWEAIVPESDWHRLQSLLGDRERPDKHHPRTAGATMLGGIARCSHGAPMHVQAGKYQASGCEHCYTTMTAARLDAVVEAWVLDRLAQPDAAAAFDLPEQTPDFRRIEDLRARRGALASLVADGLLDPADARKQLEAIKVELATLEAAARPAVALPNGDPEVVAEVWAEMSSEERRRVVRLLCTVTVNPGVRGHLNADRVQITEV